MKQGGNDMVRKAGKMIGPAGSQSSKVDVLCTRQGQGARAEDQVRQRAKSQRARRAGVRQANALILLRIAAFSREIAPVRVAGC